MHRQRDRGGLLHAVGGAGYGHRVSAGGSSRNRRARGADSAAGRLEHAAREDQKGDAEAEQFAAIRLAACGSAQRQARDEQSEQEELARSGFLFGYGWLCRRVRRDGADVQRGRAHAVRDSYRTRRAGDGGSYNRRRRAAEADGGGIECARWVDGDRPLRRTAGGDRRRRERGGRERETLGADKFAQSARGAAAVIIVAAVDRDDAVRRGRQAGG